MIGRLARKSTAILEKLWIKETKSPDNGQIFILGLPRTGTTLIYQYIVHRLNVAYFTNGVGNFPMSPCIVTAAQKKLYGPYKSDFKSNYGKVKGQNAPREAGGFWGRFFDLEKYNSVNDISSEKAGELKNSILKIQEIFDGQPFVNKNVKHIQRVESLFNIFPNSIFVVVERNLKDVALSILGGRYKNNKSPEKWWSVKPVDYDEIKPLPIAEQVFRQVVSLKEKLERDIKKISQDRVIKVNYIDFCKSPESFIKTLCDKANIRGYRNEAEQNFQIFHKEPKDAEEEKLSQLIEEYEQS